MALRAGAAETKITPPVGVDLSGYAARAGASSGVHDELFCRVVALADGATQLALVALDLIGAEVAFDQELRGAIAAASGIETSRVLVNCSHTHAGPCLSGLDGLGASDPGYVAQVTARIAATVAAARQGLTPAVAWYGEAPARVGLNRRERRETGIVIGRNRHGIVDDRVRVLSLEHEDGAPIATLFHHACHGTTLGGENTLISAEWMGAACAALKTRGVGLPVFLQGCAGQTNPEREQPSFDTVEALGARMAEAVAAARASASPMTAEPLRGEARLLSLPLQEPPTSEEAQARVAQIQGYAEGARQSGQAYLARAYEQEAAAARKAFGLTGPAPKTLEFALSGARIGDLALVGLSGEAFLEYSHGIAKASPFPHTWVLGYTDGCACYVPTAAALAEGGYESDDSFLWYGARPFVPETEQFLLQQAEQILQGMEK